MGTDPLPDVQKQLLSRDGAGVCPLFWAKPYFNALILFSTSLLSGRVRVRGRLPLAFKNSHLVAILGPLLAFYLVKLATNHSQLITLHFNKV